MKKKKGFTLIELIAVLVIMAILALIVTPLVLNIIRKARTAADKRSIDAYGRSIEIAIAGYLLDNGTFPTSIGQLTIEYSGDEVVCSTTQLNGDSSVYLTGCTVGGRSVDYSYGTDKTPPAPTYTAYSIGDEVSYNNVDYRVIANSGANESTVTLMKATPLTVAEVNLYGGVGTENNHVNMYLTSDTNAGWYQQAYNQNGYGGMAYFTSETCGYVNGDWVYDGCTTDYQASEIKYVVDAWALDKVPNGLVDARLLQYDELIDNLGYDMATWDVSAWVVNPDYTPNFVYNSNYRYWTMSQHNDSLDSVWTVLGGGALGEFQVHQFRGEGYVVRPVIVLDKSVITE